MVKLESVQEDIRDHLNSIDVRLAGIDVRLAGMGSSIALLQIPTVGVILAIIAGAVATILTR